MNAKKLARGLFFAFAGAALLAACGGDSKSAQTGLSSSSATTSASASASASNPAGSQSASASKSEEQKIVLTIDKSTIKVGETAQITSSVEGVTFESRDTSIATVDANGVVTGVKTGTVKIQARKSRYKVGNIDVTVEKAAARAADFYLEFEDAEHFDPDGFWGFVWGDYVMGPGDTPVEETEQAHGGKSIGWFTEGCKETLYFTSDKAGSVDMDFMMAYNADMDISSLLKISVNDTALDMSGKSVPGPDDGDANNYYDFNPVPFTGIAVKEGENKIVVEALGQGPNLDCVQVYTKELKIEQIPIVPVVLADIEGDFTAISIEKDATAQINLITEGVTFISQDEAIATVSATGLVTGVAKGSTSILLTKEGYKDASIAVTVTEPIPVAEGLLLELEDATHFSPNGKYGDGWGEGTDTPVEETTEAHGGKSIGNLKAECTETLTFNSTADATGSLTLVAASVLADYSGWPNVSMLDMPLSDYMTVKLNGSDLDLTGKTLPGIAGTNYYNWEEIVFSDVSIAAGENTILITITSSQGPNMDYIVVNAEGTTLSK